MMTLQLDGARGETADMIRDTARRFAAERNTPLAARIDVVEADRNRPLLIGCELIGAA